MEGEEGHQQTPAWPIPSVKQAWFSLQQLMLVTPCWIGEGTPTSPKLADPATYTERLLN